MAACTQLAASPASADFSIHDAKTGPQGAKVSNLCVTALLGEPLLGQQPSLAQGLDVGLLCLNASKSGGASRIASSVTVHNRMLASRPDLVKVLTEDFYRSRSGEVSSGDLPYFKQPIFSFTEGYFSATGVGAVIDKAQQLPGRAEVHTRPEGGGRGLSADRRGKRARHRLPARRHPVPQQLRDAAHAA